MGNYNRRLLLIQCKDLKKTISVGDVKEFEASIGRYPRRGTFGIFVSSKKSHNFNKGFSLDAIDWRKIVNMIYYLQIFLICKMILLIINLKI